MTVTRLSDGEWVLLEALAEGRCLEALPAEASQVTVQTLLDWIRSGWITGFRKKAESPSQLAETTGICLSDKACDEPDV